MGFCVHPFFMKKRKVLLAVALGLLLVLADWLAEPVFLVRGGGRVLQALPLLRPQAFSLRFIHSVQKTPVEEFLAADGQKREFRLCATRYQSFGVGLPFLPSEGDFHAEGDTFVFDHMDRHFRSISLRTGVGTQLTLTTAAGTLPLYEMFPAGTRIDLVIGRRAEALWGQGF